MVDRLRRPLLGLSAVAVLLLLLPWAHPSFYPAARPWQISTLWLVSSALVVLTLAALLALPARVLQAAAVLAVAAAVVTGVGMVRVHQVRPASERRAAATAYLGVDDDVPRLPRDAFRAGEDGELTAWAWSSLAVQTGLALALVAAARRSARGAS